MTVTVFDVVANECCQTACNQCLFAFMRCLCLQEQPDLSCCTCQTFLIY